MSKKSRRVAKARRALLSISLMLVIMLVAVSGTVAWLTDSTDEITNVFTTSNINITLTENQDEDSATEGYQFQMVPGKTIAKDPTVGVTAGSEACWLFVEVVEIAPHTTNDVDTDYDFTDFVSYEIEIGDDAWTKGDGKDIPANVYYRKVDATTAAAGVEYSVLKGDKVQVKDTVDKDMMDAISGDGDSLPELKFTAYASQLMNDTAEFTAADAWDNIQ